MSDFDRSLEPACSTFSDRGREEWWQLPRVARKPMFGDLHYGRFIRSTRIDDLLVDETVHRPGSHVPPHRHGSLLIALILEGEMAETIDGREFVTPAGSLAVRPRGMMHATRFERRSRCFSLEPGPNWLERMGAAEIVTRLELSVLTGRVVPIGLRAYTAFTMLGQDPAALAMLEGYALALLGELAGPIQVDGTPLWLQEAHRFLTEHSQERLDLESLAGRLGVHPVHLSRSFRRRYGVTMTEYRRQQRLGRAVTLLMTSDQPVSSVAEQAGFADQAHLTRVFRGSLGATPTGFRATLRGRPGSTEAD